MSKPVRLMEATLEQLEAIEGIDDDMALQILNARDTNEFIDLNVVYGITGIPRSELKKHLVEPGISALYQKLHDEIAEVRNELHHEISSVRAGLQEVDKKTLEIENIKETMDDLRIRMNKVEQTQLMGSTIQFKNPLQLLNEDKPEIPEQQQEVAGNRFGTINTLIKQKNQQAEEKFDTKQKLFSTPVSSSVTLDFPKVSPISRPTGTGFLNESYTMNSDGQEDVYASADSTLKFSSVQGLPIEKRETGSVPSVGQWPPATSMSTSDIVPAHANMGVQFEAIKMQELIGHQTKGEKGPLAPLITSDVAVAGTAGYPEMTMNTSVIYSNFTQATSPHLPTKLTTFVSGPVATYTPYWSCNVPPPGLQQQTGSAIQGFHPGTTTHGQNINTVPLQWTTPVVPPTVTTPASMDTLDRHRGRNRKRCQRESSSSSDESVDKELSRWREYSIRNRSKSPQPPKMPVFTGSGNLSWEAFIYQFERTASRRNWDNAKKLCRFLDCLSEVALEYARRSHLTRYEELRKYMKRRFSKKEEASAARRQLQYIRQGDEETLGEYAERVHFLTMDGYYRSNNDIIDQIGTEAFLRGCQEKDSARIVIEKSPRTINEALKWIKSSLANQKAIYGSRRNYAGKTQLPVYAQRQVTFSGSHSPQRPTALTTGEKSEKHDSSLQSDIRNLVSLVGQLLKDGKSPRSPSPDVRREYDRSSFRGSNNNYADQ